jgi:hypothetical protein
LPGQHRFHNTFKLSGGCIPVLCESICLLSGKSLRFNENPGVRSLMLAAGLLTVS